MKYRFSTLALLLGAGLASAGDWPQFRGPDGNGVSDEKGLPTAFGPTENVKWKATIPGRSVSSPVVLGKKVFVASASGPRMDRLHVLCIDADSGKTLWHRQLAATGNTACHPKSSMAAPTPCVNADGVYCLFATADMAAFDLDGNLKWYRSLVGDYPNISNQVGMASSPVLWRDYLIVPMDTVGDSFVAAVDTKYGQNVWKVERPKEINWTTPAIRNVGDKGEVIFSHGKATVAYNATDGKRSWTYYVGGSVPTAVTVGEKVILPTQEGVVSLKPSATGMEPEWKSAKLASGYTSPMVYGNHVYSIGRAAALVCADLKTGKEIWSERVGKGKGQFWASPIAADGKIYTCDDAGVCAVLEAGGEKANILAQNDMKAEIMGTPAIANKSIFIPTTDGLYCIAEKK